MARVARHVATDDRSVVVEVGPGYGRILRAWLAARRPFARYYGIDRSEENCEGLRREFADDARFRFVAGDAATAVVPEPFDLLLSSLTMKHLYPTFGPALAHLAAAGRDGASFAFDLLETSWTGLAIDRIRQATGRIEPIEPEPGATSRRARRARGYAYFEGDGVTYVRRYSRDAARTLVERAGLTLTAFDHVRHDGLHRRLLVVAARSHGASRPS